MHGYDEVELTNKGRKALEEGDLTEDLTNIDPKLKFPLLSVLAMTKAGHSITDMVADAVVLSGRNIQEVDVFFEGLVLYLVNKGYLRYIQSDEEEPPEFMSDFKDHF